MAENSIKPRIRFKGYTDAWEQRKLGDVGKAQSGIGFPDREQGGKEGVPFYKVSDMNNYGNEHEMHSANNYVTEEQCRRNGWTPITEISVVFAKVGAAIMLNRKRLVRFSFLLDNNTMAYRFGSGWDINFGKTLFERVDLTELVQIGALPSYNATDVESVEISMPDKPEQYQIGEFFEQIDNLITLHQRKYDKFVNIKKALLEKMFPQGDETTPKIRFKGFTDAWEQRKAEKLFISYVEKGFPELPVLSATQDKGMVYRDDTGKSIFHDKSNEIGYKRVQPGQFVIHLRSFQGGFAHSAILGITSPAYTIFWFKEGEKQCDLYWKYVFSSSEFVRRLETVTYGIRDGRSISYDEFLTMKFIVPRYEEQVKIANILIELDNLITLHQRGLIKIQGDKNGKKRSFRRIVQRLF